MNKQELIESLKWQMEAGVEDSFGDLSPIKDMKSAKKVEPAKMETPPVQEASEPELISKAHEKSSFQNFMETPTPSYKVNSDEIKASQDVVEDAVKLAESSKTLEELKTTVENFDGLEIKKLAKNTVFSDGNPEAELMLIGEAPGQNEDEQGIPFCGVSGRLLDKVFKYGGYTRDGKEKDNSFYITNTVFWRPPGNRKPLPEELAMCRPFVEKHIELINPKVIVLVGGTAIESILKTKDSVTKLRKGIHKYHNEYLDREIDCFAIYHPSYLLRQPSQKKNAWSDMLKIKKYIETR